MNEAERFLKERMNATQSRPSATTPPPFVPHAPEAPSNRMPPSSIKQESKIHTHPGKIPPTVTPIAQTAPQQHMVSILTAWSRYWTTWSRHGRASMSEYWWMILIIGVVRFAVWFIMLVSYGGDSSLPEFRLANLTTSLLFFLVLVLPSLQLSIRRLHDTNRSAWYMLLLLIPFLGPIALIYFFACPSDKTPNKYGPVPNVS